MTQLDESHIFLYGGLSEHNGSLNDAWILDTSNFNWNRLAIYLESRLWHRTIVTRENSQIYVVGGSVTDVFKQQPKYCDYITKISLSPDTLRSKCIDVICHHIKLYNPEMDDMKIPLNLEKIILLKKNTIKPVLTKVWFGLSFALFVYIFCYLMLFKGKYFWFVFI